MFNSMFGTGVNYASVKDVYPDARGASVGQVAGAQTPYTTDQVSAATSDAGGGAAAPAASSSPRSIMVTMITIIVLFVVLGVVGNKLGGREGETGLSNLKLSGYNVAYITLASMIGIGLAKIAFTKWQVPGVSTYVQAL